jgi:predicted small metal-binding protein
MKYYGKRYLYHFLKSHGYALPKMKETIYKKYGSAEWLTAQCSGYSTLQLYSLGYNCRFHVFVYEDGEDKEVQVLHREYIHGELEWEDNQRVKTFGKVTKNAI